MEFPKLLLHIGLILATITDFCVADALEMIHRLPNNTIPVMYNISLIPHLEKGNDTFHGESSVIINILYLSRNISLHSQELEINEAATTLVNGTIIYKPKKHTYDDATNILTLYFDKVLWHGVYILKMKFVGNFSQGNFPKNGFIKIPYRDKKKDNTLAATFFEPISARRMFPCWDEPELKAVFNISVMHHQKYKVISNMPMREQHNLGNGMMWTHFHYTPTMSTYLVGIVIVSNFFRVRNTNQYVNVWCKWSLQPQARFVQTIAEQVVPFLEGYTDRNKGAPKIDNVLVPNYPVDGMADWGLIIYDESKVVYDNSTDPTFRKREVASLVAYKLAYQWFGNYVTPFWWSHLWLSEGFAAFFQAYFLNKTFEDWRTMDFLVTERLQQSLSLDIGFLDSVTLKHHNTLEYGELVDNEVFNKAPAILRMLHHAVGEEVFRIGITKYLGMNPFGSVTPDDLWSAMQSALEMGPYIPYMQQEVFKIKEMMDTWINQNGYPVLNVTINYKTGEVAVTQKCFRATECINNKWWIPMTFADQSNLDFYSTMPNNWLGPDQTSRAEINTRDWIIVNVQQTAYCRVYYNTTNLERIIRYLNSKEYTNIHVLNRAQIIDDAFAFLQEDQLDSTVFRNLINYLRREKDYVPWRPMFRILSWLSKYFSLPESEGFKTYMIGIFDGLLRHIGYEENADDDDLTKMLRLDATKWACTIGHTECKRKAAVKLSEHLANPDTHKVPQWWQDWTYCFGLTRANRTTWDKIMELYERTFYKKFWEILNCAEDPDIIIHYLNITASNTTLFNDNEHAFIFIIILQNHARNDVVLDYILENFDNIKPRSRSFPTSRAIENIIWNVFSNKQISKVKRFAETNLHQDSDTLSNILNLIKKHKKNYKKSADIFTKRFGKN